MTDTIVLSKEFLESINAKQDSIEVVKTTRGYTWSVKLYSKDLLTESFKVMEEIQKIDSALRAKYGGVE